MHAAAIALGLAGIAALAVTLLALNGRRPRTVPLKGEHA
jgi:hypothetical protein